MKTTYLYTGTAIAIIGTVTGSLWATTGEAVPTCTFAALMHIILLLGWAGGASAWQRRPDRTPAAFALAIGSITNTIKTVFTRAEAERELAKLNLPGEYAAWRIVPLYCNDPQYTESECARPGAQCCGSIEFCPRDKCVLTAVSDAAINQPLV